jgi:hypothetical protein
MSSSFNQSGSIVNIFALAKREMVHMSRFLNDKDNNNAGAEMEIFDEEMVAGTHKQPLYVNSSSSVEDPESPTAMLAPQQRARVTRRG